MQDRNSEYEKSEDEFLKDWTLLPGRLLAHLDSLPLPADFKESERKRLYYAACHSLLKYPLFHTRLLRLKSFSPGENYYRKVAELLQEDSSADEFWEYRKFFRDGIQLLGEREEIGNSLDKLRYKLDYVCNNLKDEDLVSYLVDGIMSEYIKYFGSEGLEEFLPLYREKVKDEKRKEAFFRSYEQYSCLEKGRKAPSFSLADKEGKRRNLSEWLGNYVYIDVWATWCGPCCRELPIFHQLQEEFKDKSICFVSISIDANEAAWRTKIEKEGLEGIQLRVGGKDAFVNDYKISLIPRFILIDREGKIIDANMSRPSDAKTKELFTTLLLEH